MLKEKRNREREMTGEYTCVGESVLCVELWLQVLEFSGGDSNLR
jgi:hypothetical protein